MIGVLYFFVFAVQSCKEREVRENWKGKYMSRAEFEPAACLAERFPVFGRLGT